MEEKIYQNFDQIQDNPLGGNLESKQIQTDLKPKNKISLNPKIILLIILGAIIFILFVISLFVAQSRNYTYKSANQVSALSPTSTPVNSDADANYSLIPSPYQSEFQKINNYSSQDIDLPIPQIDTEAGL